jgi:hypothetical protein
MNETMIKKNEVLLKGCNKWLYFANPYRLISAETLDEVVPRLHEMERLVQNQRLYSRRISQLRGCLQPLTLRFGRALRLVLPSTRRSAQRKHIPLSLV